MYCLILYRQEIFQRKTMVLKNGKNEGLGRKGLVMRGNNLKTYYTNRPAIAKHGLLNPPDGGWDFPQ